MVVKIISATLATFFFAILFNIKKEHLIYAALGGGIGCFAYEVMLYFKIDIYAAVFLAAILVATYCEVMARYKKTTVTTFAICALIPLVPGNGMYLTMISLVNNELGDAMRYGLHTLSSAGLLALGILFISTFAKLFRKKTA